jgi:prepilin-type N-terminal cleavage/methylation domain-containing protein
MQWAKQKGFTIVELLIVVVVIAILAAITIVAYNGIQNRARESAAQAAAKQVATKLQTQLILTEELPADPEAAGFTSGSTSYQWRVDNSASPKTYCVTTTSNGTSYFVSSQNTTPSKGVCPGHALPGQTVITNLASNPGGEVERLSPYGSSVVDRSITEFRSGIASSCLTKSSAASYVNFVKSGDLAPVEGAQYRVRAWVKSSVSNILVARRSPGASSTFGTTARTVTPNAWTQIDVTLTVASGTTSFIMQVGWESGSTTTGQTLCVDDVMVTSGPNLYEYADGNSPGWYWTGTPDNSTSSGPV